jgi:hypothetical protein
VRVLIATRFAMIGVAAGAAMLATLRGYDELLGVTHPVTGAILPLLWACAAALVVGALWPLPDRMIAASADRRLALRDRIATAVELSRTLYPDGMERAQIFDAVRHLSELTPWRAYPLRFDRLAKTMVGCLALLAAVELAPIPPLLLSTRERDEQAELRAVAQQLKPAVTELEKLADEAEDEETDETDETAKRLERLTQRMERGRVPKREALLELAELGAMMKRLDEQIKPPSLKTAREAAQEIGERGREEMAKRAEELAERARQQGNRELEKQMREAAERARKASNAEDMRKLGEEMEQAAAQTGTALDPSALLDAAAVAISGEEWDEALNALESLQECLAGGDTELTQEQAEELARKLEELAKKLEGTELSELSQCLQQAGQCLRQGDCQGACQCLGQGTCAGRSGLGAAKLGEGVAAMQAAADAAAQALRRPGSSQSSGMGIGPDDGSRNRIDPNTPGASLYAPRETPVDATPEQVRSAVREGGESYLSPSPTRGAPDRVDPSRVPYYEVIGDYSRAAEDALESEEVPPAYRGTVRQYFDSLQGGNGGDGGEG